MLDCRAVKPAVGRPGCPAWILSTRYRHELRQSREPVGRRFEDGVGEFKPSRRSSPGKMIQAIVFVVRLGRAEERYIQTGLCQIERRSRAPKLVGNNGKAFAFLGKLQNCS